MNFIYRAALLITGLLLSVKLYAQESCTVLMPSLQGKYEGECKKGKANGQGKAEGADQYSGEFKDGLPHGKGKYYWANGNSYEGSWTKGKKEGEGAMTYKRASKADSMVAGFWKKDLYIGKFERPYTVYNRTNEFTKADVKFAPSTDREITVLISNTTGNTPTLTGMMPRAALNDISIMKGSYIRLVTVSETSKQIAYKLENVTFPFRAKFRIKSQEVDVEFLEAGKFILDLALNN